MEASLRRALRQRPPALPRVPHFKPVQAVAAAAPAAASATALREPPPPAAPAAATRARSYVRPPAHIVTVHRHGGEATTARTRGRGARHGRRQAVHHGTRAVAAMTDATRRLSLVAVRDPGAVPELGVRRGAPLGRARGGTAGPAHPGARPPRGTPAARRGARAARRRRAAGVTIASRCAGGRLAIATARTPPPARARGRSDAPEGGRTRRPRSVRVLGARRVASGVASAAAAAPRCASSPSRRSRSRGRRDARTPLRRQSGTTCELLVDAPESPAARRALARAEAGGAPAGALLSRFRPDSELSRLNREGRVQAGPELLELVRLALAARARTGGRFDPTVLPALVAAGYDRSFETVARRRRIRSSRDRRLAAAVGCASTPAQARSSSIRACSSTSAASRRAGSPIG